MSIVSSFVGFLIIVYSLGYIRHEENQNEYYLMVVLFIGAMMGLVFSGNLIFMYLFWEIIAICCWRLIGFYRVREHVRKADKAFLVTFFGAVVMLLGFILIYNQTGSFDLTDDARARSSPGPPSLLILFGMFSKSATVPLHTWLPDAGVAPTTVTALLHAAVLVKIGVYAYARLFLYAFQIPDVWQQIIPVVAVVSSLDRGRRGDRRDRLQADPGLLHGQPDRLHLPGIQPGQPGRDLGLAPLHPDARPGQGRPLPLRRDRHPRHAQEGHPGDGRADPRRCP